MSSDINRLISHINNQVSGIIWLTDDYIDHKTPLIFEMNYLLDGNLIKAIEEHIKVARQNFFLGSSFGKPFFISHTVFKEKVDLKNIFEQIEMIQQTIELQESIYIVNKSQMTAGINIEKELKEKFPTFHFEHLIL